MSGIITRDNYHFIFKILFDDILTIVVIIIYIPSILPFNFEATCSHQVGYFWFILIQVEFETIFSCPLHVHCTPISAVGRFLNPGVFVAIAKFR